MAARVSYAKLVCGDKVLDSLLVHLALEDGLALVKFLVQDDLAWFRVSGLGFRLEGLGLRVKEHIENDVAWFRFQGLGFRVKGLNPSTTISHGFGQGVLWF